MSPTAVFECLMKVDELGVRHASRRRLTMWDETTATTMATWHFFCTAFDVICHCQQVHTQVVYIGSLNTMRPMLIRASVT